MSREEISSSAPGFGARARSLMSSGKPRAFASLGIVLGLGAIGTLAAWSDSATATSGVFSTGSIDLEVAGEQGNPDAYAFAAFSTAGMYPGDRVSAALPVTNTGSVPFTFTIEAVSSNSDMAPYMNTLLEDGEPNSDSGNRCSGNRIGSETRLVKNGSVELLDEPITVAPGETQNVCFQTRLVTDTPPSVEGESLDVSFNFHATTA
ncbi:hypothetical protein BFN03_09740 [Rhodococcus sp. WMMA185]|uniref:SipW-dependent-type signal peptide-containing protein n=1 Tax=Rhodococcus sp. WMMA185 TaxID=679318 RepID=UPI0008788A74|nr:SipW-dependent-type signal peptide-containing protein [Rhodococcus sp. WMMA185]AOW92861.1 hypothetical protein BFN03_09720 [Rhodococcus sp. WMMA185]AOW92865.1 hypothetical protein BFN03_09740 [Rhodococcus sp. WMMA185]